MQDNVHELITIKPMKVKDYKPLYKVVEDDKVIFEELQERYVFISKVNTMLMMQETFIECVTIMKSG